MDAFHRAKYELADATMLVHPVPSAPTRLMVDASLNAHLHVDLVCPLPPSRGQRYGRSLLTIIGRYTRCREVVPCLMQPPTQLLAPLPRPGSRTLDHAPHTPHHTPQGVHHIRTSAYRPASNDIVERLRRQLEVAIIARDANSTGVNHHPLVLFYNLTAPKQDMACSAAQLFFGTTLRLPGDVWLPTSLPPPLLMQTTFKTCACTSRDSPHPPTTAAFRQHQDTVHQDLTTCAHSS
ncbi:uncharacterized protein LOC135377917 [Ornithodoros turicata]|uniref:uncharacterized protein LOC135377917 n=1 Tax=Ornithodoros turicata TaxID=34597 RepID=UPI00313A2C9C